MCRELIDFIRKLYGDGYIPLHEPVIGDREKNYVNQALDTGYVSSVGPMVQQFETEFASFIGSKHAIGTSSGTSALHLCLLAARVELGDEVITQSLTFVATGNAISYVGGKPIFLDVNEKTLGLCPKALLRFLEQNTEIKNGLCINKITGNVIKAAIPMHTFGHPCQIDEIAQICEDWKICLIEDAAEAVGSRYKNRPVGTHGIVSAFSFNGNKILTTGSGGMVVTNDNDLAIKIRHWTNTAKVQHPWEYYHDETGYNYRMGNLNAALGLAQLEQVGIFVERKRSLAEEYRIFFENRPERFFLEPTNVSSNYWLNAIIFSSQEERNAFLESAHASSIGVRPVWNPLHTLPMFQHELTDNLTVTNDMAQKLVNLPSSVIEEITS
ncbi:LegC family aminotransferase [Kiloniella litopenaei]|uniref:LegC family aminotransferase n=1 Tax=Kiloniella litopenaei TaxID=1549748 RepID=UPI003BAB2178